ncbi:right-handed parallel beta-helix repeat-containing protein [Curtobacterium sp. MCBD17_032]|uniref:right-handed parallel beta-helix repeat-containing protein n=1 Tax=Curtobacterium sp. MCBD17_032 TaxID=2175659 RepID=UPI000DA94BA8|nr:right-handed parallel beta-helix repeat-containing protein [Curtobacterium sp. MCBD17_032]PZE86383.1 right-handed parallel beta-helix repeat-containing protein [Curtobacterium sp. MCBD17_032]
MIAVRSAVLRGTTALAVGMGLVLAGLAAAPTAAVAATPTGATTATAGRPYAGDPDKEARLVAAENDRVYNVRALASAARWSGLAVSRPYRLATGSSYTLVLVARGAAYTIDDLTELAPSTFVKQPDGSWLLSENIVVENGATLRLASPDGLRIHLESNHEGFVSIVTQAGGLQVVGSAKAPVAIDAWDPQAGAVDTQTSDGRAYVRVQGGTATLQYASFSHLGFWSGTTGGVSLTGTDLTTLDRASGDQEGKTKRTTKDVFGNAILPTGALPSTGEGSANAGSYSYVSALVQHVTFDGNAFGLFLTSADGVTMSDATVKRSLIDGLVLHRYVTNSTFTSVRTTDNAMDGVKMTRASTGIVFSQVRATGNGRNGITLNGSGLAAGPNAAGMPTTTYGNNALTDSTSSDNGRYGVEVIGGKNVRVSGSTAAGNEMGIVVRHDADDVVIRNNVVKDSTQNGIAVLDGPTATEVSENSVDGAAIGVYLRESTSSSVTDNTITAARVHGVTTVGPSAGTEIEDNAVRGSGPSAIDLARSDGAVQQGNTTVQWHSTKPLLVTLRAVFQPLTVLWLVLLTVVLVAAVGGVRRRRRAGHGEHPYAKLAPLSSFTRGAVDPTTLGLPPAPTLQGAHAAAPGAPSRTVS